MAKCHREIENEKTESGNEKNTRSDLITTLVRKILSAFDAQSFYATRAVSLHNL